VGISWFGVSGAFLERGGEVNSVKVDDRAELMLAEQSDWIGQYHKKLLEEFDVDYRVLTVSDIPEDIKCIRFSCVSSRIR
jgi:hypothetical protein